DSLESSLSIVKNEGSSLKSKARCSAKSAAISSAVRDDSACFSEAVLTRNTRSCAAIVPLISLGWSRSTLEHLDESRRRRGGKLARGTPFVRAPGTRNRTERAP